MGAIIGILFIAAGGLASASFYLPLKNVKGGSWESGWHAKLLPRDGK